MSRCGVGLTLEPAMAMERWERNEKRRAEREPRICRQLLPTSNLHCYLSVFFLNFLGGCCCCRSCSCSRASIWMWRLDMDTQQLSCKKGGGAHGNIQTKRFSQHKKIPPFLASHALCASGICPTPLSYITYYRI